MSRLIVWARCGIVRLLAAGLLGLAGAVGLRGVRLWWLAAIALGVAWAAHAVGLRAAVALALAGWLWWATRHQRARLRQRTAYRRLTRELRSHTHPLHARYALHAPRALKSRRAGRGSRASRVAVVADALAPPRLTAGQTPEQGMRALERYAAAWTRRHTHIQTHIQPAAGHGVSAADAADREGR
jgi:hypothetical protein